MADDTEGVTIGSDAAAGATAGAMFGPWGALIGGLIGAGIGIFGGSRAAKARKQALRDEVALAENRRSLMEIETFQKQRENTRNIIAARGAAAAAEVQSGAEISGRTSAVGGAEGGIQGQGSTNANALFYAEQNANKAIDLQEKLAYDKNAAENAQALAGLGSTIGSLGGPIGRIAGFYNPTSSNLGNSGGGAGPTTQSYGS